MYSVWPISCTEFVMAGCHVVRVAPFTESAIYPFNIKAL